MRKELRNSLICFLLGAFIFGSIGVVAANYISTKNIDYSPANKNWDVDNADDAINSLYDKLSNKCYERVELGKISLYSLLTDSCIGGCSFTNTYDVSNYSDYKNFTKDNFSLNIDSVTSVLCSSSGSAADSTLHKNSMTTFYNNETGILTVETYAYGGTCYRASSEVSVYLDYIGECE